MLSWQIVTVKRLAGCAGLVGKEYVMEVLQYVFYALCVIVVAYLVVRAASFAYFRTKLEYLRSVFKEIRGHNGSNHGS